MKRHAFTLVELMVVVTIIALLLAMLMPSLSTAVTLGRTALCAHNLSQINSAFHGKGTGGKAPSVSASKPYCHPNRWPSDPMKIVPDSSIYKCPEAPVTEGSGSEGNAEDYCIRTNLQGSANLDIPFEHNYNPDGLGPLCRLIEDDEDHSLWGFEDGFYRDLYTGSIDIKIHVDKQTMIGKYVSGSYQGASQGTLSLVFRGEVVPGWANFRSVPTGKTFPMMGTGMTNYGINAKIDVYEVAPGTIVLLDYTKRVVDLDTESDIVGQLIGSARHRGRLNVLHSDGSVRQAGPTELDPEFNPIPWSPQGSD